MSDGLHDETQIPMICATGALKTGPVRIGHIAGDFTLPRTVALPTFAAVLAGLILGAGFAAVGPVGGIQGFLLSMTFGGLIGYVLASYSPLKGESMLTWLGLQVNTLRKQRRVRGEAVVVAVGIAPVSREPLGKFRMQRAAVRVAAGRYDERGVVISHRNRNVPEGAHGYGGHIYVPEDPPVSLAGRPAPAPMAVPAPAMPAVATPQAPQAPQSAGRPTFPARPHTSVPPAAGPAAPQAAAPQSAAAPSAAATADRLRRPGAVPPAAPARPQPAFTPPPADPRQAPQQAPQQAQQPVTEAPKWGPLPPPSNPTSAPGEAPKWGPLPPAATPQAPPGQGASNRPRRPSRPQQPGPNGGQQ